MLEGGYLRALDVSDKSDGLAMGGRVRGCALPDQNFSTAANNLSSIAMRG
jgi:hypothetical protein